MNQKNFALLILAFTGWLYLNSCNASNLQNTSNKPTPEVIPGWKHYEVDNFSFRLPETYHNDTDLYKETYPEELKYIFFLAREVHNTSQTSKTVFTLTKQKVRKSIFFEEYVEKFIAMAGPQYEILNRTKLYGDYPTEKIISRNNKNEIPYIFITYISFVGNKIYRIEIQCEESNYTANQDEFEEIYQNIQITRENVFSSFIKKYEEIICMWVVTLVIIIIGFFSRNSRQRKNHNNNPPVIPDDF